MSSTVPPTGSNSAIKLRGPSYFWLLCCCIHRLLSVTGAWRCKVQMKLPLDVPSSSQKSVTANMMLAAAHFSSGGCVFGGSSSKSRGNSRLNTVYINSLKYLLNISLIVIRVCLINLLIYHKLKLTFDLFQYFAAWPNNCKTVRLIYAAHATLGNYNCYTTLY